MRTIAYDVIGVNVFLLTLMRFLPKNTTFVPSIYVIRLTLTLKMTTAQVVETSVTDNNNGPMQDYVHPDDHTYPTY